jgi:hypothetical protein
MPSSSNGSLPEKHDVRLSDSYCDCGEFGEANELGEELVVSSATRLHLLELVEEALYAVAFAVRSTPVEPNL